MQGATTVILSTSSIRVIAELGSRKKEYEFKGYLKKLEIVDSEQEYWRILDVYKDISSSSKEAKLEAVLTYLNKIEEDKLLGFVNLLLEGLLSYEDSSYLNNYLQRDGLLYDMSEKFLKPSLGHFEEEGQISSELEEMLEEINPDFLAMYRGAWEALSSGTVDSFRHCISSTRELLSQLLRELAPEATTRKSRVKLILNSESQSELVDNISRVIDKLYGVLSGKEHTSPDYLSTLYTLKMAEYTIYYILKKRLE